MFDLAVIGGGVNGCGIARDAGGRGLRVLLVEKGDLASGTSSASTKLVHGGLRYLEHYEFRLVREALLEREVLMGMAPHIIWPLRFVLPHHKGLRPAWLIRLGLFLYDHLGGRKLLAGCAAIDLRRDPAGEVLRPAFRKGFEYSDCWVDDARLVVANARDAGARGADIRVRTELIAAERVSDHWNLKLVEQGHAEATTVSAKAVVNAAGPWVDEVLRRSLDDNRQARARLVRGSHIVVKRLFDHDRAYIFQNADARIVFAIPYEDDFTLIGTTDVDVTGDPGAATISGDEIEYLCGVVGDYFRNAITPDDIVWTYAGVRSLFDEGTGAAKAAQRATRDYTLDFHGGAAPMLNVFGGKITTYRRLAEEAVDRFKSTFPAMSGAWTRGATLPGGEMPVGGHATIGDDLRRTCKGLDPQVAARWARTYGSESHAIPGGATSVDGLGRHFGGGLYEAELAFLIEREWARSADDVLWRRTKLGLRLNPDEVRAVEDWLSDKRHGPAGEVGKEREVRHG